MSKDRETLERIRNDQAALRVFPPWAVILSAGLALVTGIALFFLSASLILIATPIIAIVFLYMRWKLRKSFRNTRYKSTDAIIDADYTIIDESRER